MSLHIYIVTRIAAVHILLALTSLFERRRNGRQAKHKGQNVYIAKVVAAALIEARREIVEMSL